MMATLEQMKWPLKELLGGYIGEQEREMTSCI